MANDRMYLLNMATKEKVFIAKHFGVQWEVREPEKPLAERLDQLFQNSEPALNFKAYRIIYETDEDF